MPRRRSSEVAAEYPGDRGLTRCKAEDTSRDRIGLIGDIEVEAGKTRAYDQFADGYATGIDTDAKILPIPGSLTNYQCHPPAKDDGPYHRTMVGIAWW